MTGLRLFFDNKKLPEDYAKAASLVYDTEANLDVDHDLSIFPVETKSEFPDGLTTIAPIHVSGIRLGSLIIGAMIKNLRMMI